jgi:hypothetical protein
MMAMTFMGIIATHLIILLVFLSGGDPLEPGEAADGLSRRTYEIVASGNHAFAATTAGLTVYDISGLSHPEEITTLHFPGSANAVSVSEGLAFVSLGPDGLRIIDVSDPAAPRVVGTLDADGSVNAAVSATVSDMNLVVIADGVLGVKVARFDGEGSVEVVSQLDTGGYARHLAVHENLVAVADEEYGVRFLRLEPSGGLTEVGSVSTPGSARGVVLLPLRCYVASGLAGVVILDVSSPSRPEILGTIPSEDYARGLAVGSGTVYLADSGAGLRMFEERPAADEPAPSGELGTYDTAGIANRVSLLGETALVAADGAGIDLVDVSNPKKPRSH